MMRRVNCCHGRSLSYVWLTTASASLVTADGSTVLSVGTGGDLRCAGLVATGQAVETAGYFANRV